jgi:hypothetical protein
MISPMWPGIEPGTCRLLGGRDNHIGAYFLHASSDSKPWNRASLSKPFCPEYHVRELSSLKHGFDDFRCSMHLEDFRKHNFPKHVSISVDAICSTNQTNSDELDGKEPMLGH